MSAATGAAEGGETVRGQLHAEKVSVKLFGRHRDREGGHFRYPQLRLGDTAALMGVIRAAIANHAGVTARNERVRRAVETICAPATMIDPCHKSLP